MTEEMIAFLYQSFNVNTSESETNTHLGIDLFNDRSPSNAVLSNKWRMTLAAVFIEKGAIEDADFLQAVQWAVGEQPFPESAAALFSLISFEKAVFCIRAIKKEVSLISFFLNIYLFINNCVSNVCVVYFDSLIY
jgi:hypothetical protein